MLYAIMHVLISYQKINNGRLRNPYPLNLYRSVAILDFVLIWKQ